MPEREANLLNVEVFRAGEYGERGTFTADDLATIAATYSPGMLEAPVTLDHDQWGRAYGWVVSVRAEGSRLFADMNIHEDMLESLRKGEYRKRSVEIYNSLKEAGGKLYLKAVSFLGAAAPAVKGMQDLAFADGAESVAIEFSESEPQSNPDPIAPKGEPIMHEKETPTQTQAPAAPVVSVEQFAAVQDELAETKAALAAAKTEATKFSERVESLSESLVAMKTERDRERAEAEFGAAFSQAVNEGKAAPAERDSLLAIFSALPEGGEVRFGEEKLSSRTAFLRTITDRPTKAPGTARISRPGAPESTPDLSDPQQFAAARAELADKLVAENPKLDFADAVVMAATKLRSGK
jgi:hypothetical protein